MKLPLSLNFAHMLGLARSEKAHAPRSRRDTAPSPLRAIPKAALEPEEEEGASEAERRAYHTAASAERARWAAVILTHADDAPRLGAAIKLLETTNLSAASINRTVASFILPPAAPAVSSLYARMAARPPVQIGQDAIGYSGSGPTFAHAMQAAMDKVRPPAPPIGFLRDGTPATEAQIARSLPLLPDLRRPA